MLKRAFYWFTGGRPMTYIGPAFQDIVSGKWVNDYVDGFGRKWMAENRWGSFRVPKN